MQAGRRVLVTRFGAAFGTAAGYVMNLKTQVQACPMAVKQGQPVAKQHVILHLNKCNFNKESA